MAEENRTQEVATERVEGAVSLAVDVAKAVEHDMVAELERADGFVITTQEQMEASAGLLRSLKARAKALTDLRLSITRPMDDAKKRVMAAFAPGLDKLTNAENVVKQAVLTWTREQERLRAEEQARLDRIAEQEREALTEQAAERREEGFHGRADALEGAAENVHAQQAAPHPKPSGPVHVRTTWRAEVEDLKALALAVGEGRAPAEYVTPNMPVLNAMARAAKDAMEVPGVKAVSEQSVAARS